MNNLPTAIVTGAARGIGLTITRRFLDAGHRVAMLDIDGHNLQAAVTAIDLPELVLPLQADVSNRDSVAQAIEQVQDNFGRIDSLVNNAGVATFKPFMQTTVDDWTEILSVNLNGAFHCSQLCVPLMLQGGGGAIVNITSISGLRASTLRTAYGTSKAGLAHLTKQMAAELGHQGIRVNAVAPGPIDTAMAKKVHSASIRADYHAAIPLNRYGAEEEIANAVLFLCSDKAGYVNGQELAVDGGFHATGIGLEELRQRNDLHLSTNQTGETDNTDGTRG